MSQSDWYFLFITIWLTVLVLMIIYQLIKHHVKKTKYEVNKEEKIHERKNL